MLLTQPVTTIIMRSTPKHFLQFTFVEFATLCSSTQLAAFFKNILNLGSVLDRIYMHSLFRLIIMEQLMRRLAKLAWLCQRGKAYNNNNNNNNNNLKLGC